MKTVCPPAETINQKGSSAIFKTKIQVSECSCHVLHSICLAEPIILKVTPSFGFVTECFFMTHHCLNLGE